MKIDIPIYRAEAEVEGLAEKIRANCSIAYCSPLQPMPDSEREHIHAALAQAMTSHGKTLTIGNLYPTKSVLASTVWNLNDDVFDCVETWAARHTPVDKPSNVEHKEEQIVGHMTQSWAVSDSGDVLADDLLVSDLPNLYHLCNGAVIYTHWQKKELIDRTEALIEEIEAGNKFVSMECLFNKFDYAISSDGAFHIVARNDESAFLTKYLRAYGGSGEFEGHKVGRLLRNFAFSGKGYVDKPANPDSIIFTDAVPFNFSQATHENPFVEHAGVYLTYRRLNANKSDDDNIKKTERTTMSETNELIQSQLNETKEALRAANTLNKELGDKLTEAGIAKYENRIEELEGLVEAAKKKADEDKKAKDADKSKAEELEVKVTELTEANVALTEKVEAAEAEKVCANRMAALVDGGIAKTDAEEKVEKFANLNDEQFETLASELVEAAKAKKGVEGSEEKTPEQSSASEEETDDAEANADEEVLDDAKADEEVDGTAAGEGEEDEATKTRKALASFISHRLGKTTSEDDKSKED